MTACLRFRVSPLRGFPVRYRREPIRDDLPNCQDRFRERLSKAYGRNITTEEADNAKQRLRDFLKGLRRCKQTATENYLLDDQP